MGTAISNMVAATPDMEIVLGLDTFKTDETRHYPIYSSINDQATPADAIISYLPPSATDDTMALLNFSVKNRIPLIICTTGLSQEIENTIANAAKKTVIFYSKNMSLGVNVLTHILKNISKLLYDSNFDIELIEKHHNKKLDAPSGTAFMLLDAIKEAVGSPLQTITDRSSTLTERKPSEIGVSAVRGGNIIGEHSVIFAGQNETLEITHAAQSRDVFAEGTLKAVRFMCNKPPGLYTMQDLIETF